MAVVILGALPASLEAHPPYQKFVEGLRQRGYFELALRSLDNIEANPSAPEDIKASVDYQRAVTLIAQARTTRDPSTKVKRLDAAKAALDRFVAEHPSHSLVGAAQLQRGNILLGKAKGAILEAKAPGNEAQSQNLREDARELLDQARAIFAKARGKFEAQWKSFGPYVDEDNTQERAARDAALTSLMEARLKFAECTRREAESYRIDNPQRNKLFDKAAQLYEEIHSDYRTNVGGLFARLWMGKCYEEQAPRPEPGRQLSDAEEKDATEKLNIAEAIYTELLQHDTRGKPAAARMQDYAFWFKMIVRNHPALDDHQLVVDLVNQWLKARRGAEAQSLPARGVRWQRAKAYEALANARRDIPEGDRTHLLQQALNDAEFVNAFGGEFRDVSRAMIQRVKAALGRGEGTPDNFDAANGFAHTLFNRISQKQAAVQSAKSAKERKEADQDLQAHLVKTADMLLLAISLAQSDTPRSALNGARYRLAYVDYLRGRLYDTVVLGSFLGTKFEQESPQLSLDASYLALAAFYELYDESTGAEREFALGQVQSMAGYITKTFPKSAQANESRMMLGRIYQQANQFQQAAEWFTKVPPDSPQGREARLLAGRSFWDTFAKLSSLPEKTRPSQKDLDGLKKQAEQFLRQGLDLAEQQIPDDAELPANVGAGKVTLAQIYNLEGKFKEAIQLLKGGKNSVVAATKVEHESQRPAEGLQSRAFATIVHQQLLRADIGLNKTNAALAEMEVLKRIGGEGNTAIFINLGQQIEEELKSLPEGPQRRARMAGFDQFLTRLSQMQQGQTYSSLLWIAETYFGLAQAANGPKRTRYFDQAVKSYKKILSRVDEAGFLPSSTAAIGIRLRLAQATAVRGQFERAYELARQVLKQMPRALNAQIATAKILRDWGMSGRAEAPEKLLLAIQGDRSGGVAVWGWGKIAQQLQRLILSGKATEEFQELYRQARYEIPAARAAYAKTRSDQEQFDKALQRAERELLSYVAVTPQKQIGDQWWTKLESLYTDIQQDLGIVNPKPLEPAKEYEPAAPDPAEDQQASEDVETDAVAPSSPSATAEEEESSSVLPMIFGILLMGGVGGGVLFTVLRGKKPTPGRRGVPERLPEATFSASSPARDDKQSERKRRARRAKSTHEGGTSRAAGQANGGESHRKQAAGTRKHRASEAAPSRSRSSASRPATSSHSHSKNSPEEGSDGASRREIPKAVKPRVVKKPRRTKPSE